jgi:hypothetical protein
MSLTRHGVAGSLLGRKGQSDGMVSASSMPSSRFIKRSFWGKGESGGSSARDNHWGVQKTQASDS